MPNTTEVAAALAYSRYATAALDMRPDERAWLVATVDAPFDWGAAEASIARILDGGDPTALAAALRRVRRRVFIQTLVRDLTGRAGLAEVCANMTMLAESALRAAVTLHHRALAADYGEPRDERGAAQGLVVIGMGKLGGAELTFRPMWTWSSSIRKTEKRTAHEGCPAASFSNGWAGA